MRTKTKQLFTSRRPAQIPILMSCCLAIWSVTVAAQNLDSLVTHAIVFSKHQLEMSIMTLGDTAMFPRCTKDDRQWKLVKANDWTSGFFPGCLWFAATLTGDSNFIAHAARWTNKLEPQKLNTQTHDVGFIMNCSFGNGFKLTSNESYREILVTAARSLASRFNPRVGCIKSWDNRRWPFPVIIDNMMNLELLFCAAKNGGLQDLHAIAMSHALKTMENHLRGDGSAYHVVSYDSTTGTVSAKQTHQGYADESVWARGQAWAIYGFTMAYRETKDVRFLQAAERSAGFFLEHLPDDQVPFWDFRAPGIPHEPRDVSAAAIACSALFELSTLSADEMTAESYSNAARRILGVLCQPPYLAEGTPSSGILNHATGNKPAQSEIDVSLIYADYYFLESILRFRHMEGR